MIAGCQYPGCPYPHHARGWCATHNWRIRKWGSPEPRPRATTPATERFWAKVETSGDCWLWTGARAGGGYGWFMASRGVAVPAHRWSYEHLIGPIGNGLQLDHLCRVRSCVNPDHLEPVTQAENIRRGYGYAAWQRAKTHCPLGHPYAGDNLLLDNGRRRCRICTRQRASSLAA